MTFTVSTVSLRKRTAFLVVSSSLICSLDPWEHYDDSPWPLFWTCCVVVTDSTEECQYRIPLKDEVSGRKCSGNTAQRFTSYYVTGKGWERDHTKRQMVFVGLTVRSRSICSVSISMKFCIGVCGSWFFTQPLDAAVTHSWGARPTRDPITGRPLSLNSVSVCYSKIGHGSIFQHSIHHNSHPTISGLIIGHSSKNQLLKLNAG